MKLLFFILMFIALWSSTTSQECSNGQVRDLSNHTGEVYYCHNGTWTAVCNEATTTIVCRQLGYNATDVDDHPIMHSCIASKHISCNNNSTMLQDYHIENCTCKLSRKYFEAGVTSTPDCDTEGDLRVVNGSREGIVEVCVNGRWGIVSNSSQKGKAGAVCSHLGLIAFNHLLGQLNSVNLSLQECEEGSGKMLIIQVCLATAVVILTVIWIVTCIAANYYVIRLNKRRHKTDGNVAKGNSVVGTGMDNSVYSRHRHSCQGKSRQGDQGVQYTDDAELNLEIEQKRHLEEPGITQHMWSSDRKGENTTEQECGSEKNPYALTNAEPETKVGEEKQQKPSTIQETPTATKANGRSIPPKPPKYTGTLTRTPDNTPQEDKGKMVVQHNDKQSQTAQNCEEKEQQGEYASGKKLATMKAKGRSIPPKPPKYEGHLKKDQNETSESNEGEGQEGSEFYTNDESRVYATVDKVRKTSTLRSCT